ncbi:hypothetical protein N7488_008950 [Penicillium malachiteum]|nr:hypothetical protein N7488_008950 [Penicillium malachiteum]
MTKSDYRSLRKSARQKHHRRRKSMMKKAREYSKICSADVCVGIRMRETGRVHILSADSSGFWDFLAVHLSSHYPAPILVTDRDVDESNSSVADDEN